MTNKLDLNELREDIAKHLEVISVERRMAKDLGYDVLSLDKFIAEEGAKQINRFDTMSVEELMSYMIADIADMLDTIKSV